jgi:hypothetical protein
LQAGAVDCCASDDVHEIVRSSRAAEKTIAAAA